MDELKIIQVKDGETFRDYCHPKDIVKAIGYIPYNEITDDEIWKSSVGNINDSERIDPQRIRSFIHLIQTKNGQRGILSYIKHPTDILTWKMGIIVYEHIYYVMN